MPSSSLGRALLDVLKGAGRLMTVNQITRRVRKKGLKVSEARVLECLKQDLQDRANHVQGRWTLQKARPNEEREEATRKSKAGTEEAQGPPGGKPKQASEDDEASMPVLAREIVSVLEEADLPLKAHHIVGLLAQRGYRVDKPSVNRCLYRHLDERVKRDGRTRWSLRKEETILPPPRDSLAQGVVRVLAKEEGPLPTNVVATRLSAQETNASSPDVAAALFDLKEQGHVERDGQGRWYLENADLAARIDVIEPEASVEGHSLPPAESEEPAHDKPPARADEQPEKSHKSEGKVTHEEGERAGSSDLRERVFSALTEAPASLKTDEVVQRLTREGPEVERKTVVMHLHALRREGRISGNLDVIPFAWRAGSGERPHEEKKAETPPRADKDEVGEALKDLLAGVLFGVLEEKAAPSPPNDAKTRVLRTLARASQALSSTEVVERLAEEGMPVEHKTVVEHLYQLRKEERVLVDQRFRWHAAQGERDAAGPGKKAEATETEDAPLHFAPEGHVTHVAEDLECAGQVALVLELASRPLETPELAALLSEMGLATAVEDMERVLAGPLRAYVQRGDEGWTLRPKADPATETKEERVVPGRTVSGSQRDHSLAAQTRTDGMKYDFAQANLDTPAFFDAVRKGASTTQVRLNTAHPAHGRLQAAQEVGATETDAGALRRQLREVQRALRLLLVGWARYEENLEGPLRRRTQKMRSDWGRSVRRIMQRHEERVPDQE